MKKLVSPSSGTESLVHEIPKQVRNDGNSEIPKQVRNDVSEYLGISLQPRKILFPAGNCLEGVHWRHIIQIQRKDF